MMQVYRISQTRYAEDLTGEGARLFGGRWNVPMVSCIYTSESRALAVLEYSANVNLYEIRRALSIITYEIDEQKIYHVAIPQLPGNWKDNAVPKETQLFGTNLLVNEKHPMVRIPSVIIPDEFNYLVNPLYYQSLEIISIQDYAYDLRVKTT